MKIIKEYPDGFRLIDGDATSGEFKKDSQKYKDLIAEGCDVVTLSKAEKESSVVNEENSVAQSYLARTDWMVIRQLDSGEPMPDDIKTLRQEARDKIK